LPHIEGNTLPDALPPDFYLGFPMPDTSLTAQIKTVGNRVNKTVANHTGFHKKNAKNRSDLVATEGRFKTKFDYYSRKKNSFVRIFYLSFGFLCMTAGTSKGEAWG
jgi:ribosomal protein S15P/S13E